MSGRGLLPVWARVGLLGVAVACSTTLRFDDHSIDSGAGADSGGECDDDECGFVPVLCREPPCPLECPYDKSCVGRCGTTCTADCEEGSTCVLTAGEDADLECEQRARCSFVVGRAGRIECEPNADCSTRCLGSCSVLCGAGATCELACGDSAPPVSIVDIGSCP